MKIVVTGHTGFIGKVVCSKLEKCGWSVVGLSRSTNSNINDSATFESLGKFDVMIHLASNTFIPDSFNEPSKFFKENLTGTVNALEACRVHKAKMIYISSYVYGHPQHLPINEEHPLLPANPYSWSKKLGEDICRAYSMNFKVRTHIIRPFNVYGPGQQGKFLIPLILDQLVKGTIKLQDQRPRRDFIHVEDLADAIVSLVNYDEDWNVFNIGSGVSTSISDITNMLVNADLISQDKISFTNEHRDNEVLETVANIDKAFQLLNWKPTKEFEPEFLRMAKAMLEGQ